MMGSGEIPNIEVPTLDTFVSLRITTRVEEEEKLPQPDRVLTSEKALEIARASGRAVLILGDAGSGKTTLLKYYVMSCLSGERYRDLGFTEPPLPILLQLRQLGEKGTTLKGLPVHLSQSTSNHEPISEECFRSWLDRPTTLVMLDGLDEICNVEQRQKVCRWIDRAVQTYKRCSFVITSRRTGYRRADKIQLACHPVELQVEDFTQEQQAEFLRRWFLQAYLNRPYTGAENRRSLWEQSLREGAVERANTIIEQLTKPDNKAIQELTRTPLILQIVAILWKDRKHLPKARSDLYRNALNYLLFDREAEKAIDSDNESLKPRLSADESLRVLRPVCLWMQEKKQSDEVGKKAFHSQARTKLKSIAGDMDGQTYCQDLCDRTGLIAECGTDHYMFCHKSFREYLAGVQLATVRAKRPERIAAIVEHFGDDWWDECLRFMMAEADDKLFDHFMKALFKSTHMVAPNDRQKELLRVLMSEVKEVSTDALKAHLLDRTGQISDEQKTVILRDCLRPMGRRSPHPHRQALSVVRQFAEEGTGSAVAVAREIVAEDMGEDMLEQVSSVGSLRNPLELNAEYIFIQGPGRPFVCKATNKEESPSDLHVAKYPVTNKHYRRFVRYLDAQEPELTDLLPLDRFRAVLSRDKETDAFLGSDETQGRASFQSRYDDHKDFKGDDQPVVGVSWYAARAYCLWLTELERTVKSDESTVYRLPNDAEW
ncbi:MAG: NACHT domain-containing protein [Planctomycetes bacterium]|nr:NACHT domain-containing protein [Planctomycetota bacterium]